MLSTQRRYSIQGGHCVSTDHCPPSLDICTSTHRACSGCSVLAVSGATSCGRISLLLAARTSFISTRPAGTFLRQSTCCRSRDVPEFQGLVIINKHLLIGTKPTTFYSFITPALHSHSYPPLEPCFCIEPLLNFTSVSSRGWIFPSMNEFKLYVAHLTVKLCPSFLCISGANFPTQKGWKRRHNEQNNTECTSGMLQSTVRLKYANLEQWNFCLAVNSPASFTLSGSTACPHIPGTITHHTAHCEMIIPKSKLDTTKKWCVVRAF